MAGGDHPTLGRVVVVVDHVARVVHECDHDIGPHPRTRRGGNDRRSDFESRRHGSMIRSNITGTTTRPMWWRSIQVNDHLRKDSEPASRDDRAGQRGGQHQLRKLSANIGATITTSARHGVRSGRLQCPDATAKCLAPLGVPVVSGGPFTFPWLPVCRALDPACGTWGGSQRSGHWWLKSAVHATIRVACGFRQRVHRRAELFVIDDSVIAPSRVTAASASSARRCWCWQDVRQSG